MPVNFNRPANFFLILTSLAVAGCSQTSKNTLSLNNDNIDNTTQQSVYIDHYYRAYPTADKQQVTKTAIHHENTVWERLLSLYALPKIENERIDREIDWYLNHPNSLATIQRRAEPYLHLILDEIEAKKIPGELALLPVVESAFLPNAYSKADASGLWQFIPSTGRMFGLQQNSWYDGRRDIYASTKAATTYLKQLSESFDGDWLLALASYNWGKGNVIKSIDKNLDRNLPTDYWSLAMPEETHNYVPRLLAVAKIFANADEYNVDLKPIPNQPYVEVVDVKSQLNLEKAAELANTSLQDLLKLNPAFNKKTTAPQGPHRLLIPVEKASQFKENLAQLSIEERAGKHFDAEEETVVALQDIDVKQDPIRHHDIIKSPAKPKSIEQKMKSVQIAKQSDIKEKTVNNKSAKDLVLANQTYTIKKGDTLVEVAKKFDLNAKDIATKNKLNSKSLTTLAVGQKLTLKNGLNLAMLKNQPTNKKLKVSSNTTMGNKHTKNS